MPVTAKWFGQAIMQAFGSGSAGGAPNIDFLSDTIKVALFTSAHAPDQDTDVYYDGANGMIEVSNGNGYTTGGATLATKTLGYTAGTNVIKFDGDDVTWAASTITARYAEIYDDTPASNKPLLAYVDFGADVVSSAGNFTITWDAAGICLITPA
jgi:hypothetical protein